MGELHCNSPPQGFLSTTNLISSPSSSANASPSKANPFAVLTELLCHNAHLAVFVNYVLQNSDPSSLVRQFSNVPSSQKQ